MHREQQHLDSYQNPISYPRENESVEAIGVLDDSEGVESPDTDDYRETAANYTTDTRWNSDEDAERLASDVIPDRSGDEDAAPEDDAAGRGRAASGETFEDEEDESLFFPRP